VVPDCTVWCQTAPCGARLYRVVPDYTVWCQTVPCGARLYRTVPDCTVPYHARLYLRCQTSLQFNLLLISLCMQCSPYRHPHTSECYHSLLAVFLLRCSSAFSALDIGPLRYAVGDNVPTLVFCSAVCHCRLCHVNTDVSVKQTVSIFSICYHRISQLVSTSVC